MKTFWVHHETDPEGYRAAEAFASTRIWGEVREFGLGTAMWVVHQGAARAAAIFHNYHPEDGVIELSLAGDGKRWMTRPVLFEMFRFAFDILKCVSLVTRTSPANTPLARIQKAYGFQCHIIPNLRGRNGDEIVSVLTDSAWRANGFHKESANG